MIVVLEDLVLGFEEVEGLVFGLLFTLISNVLHKSQHLLLSTAETVEKADTTGMSPLCGIR